jgi:hypothetical protein
MSDESITRVYELTRTLVAALEAGDLSLAADLSDERSPLVMSLSRDQAQTDEDLTMIREIVAMDATIMGMASTARDAISSTFNQAQQRVSAAHQYVVAGQLR